MMKKAVLIVAVALTAIVTVSCGNKQMVQPQGSSPGNEGPFGETFETPCQVYDTKTEFAATGIFRGSSNQKGEVQKNALLNAQDLIRLKMQHSYKGLVSEYSSSVGNNKGNDIERKMSSAGDRIIDAIVNETEQSCVRWSAVYPDGHIECYTAIQISKAETAERIANEVENKLSQDEKMRIGFNEEQFRKKMQRSFEEYKGSN